MRFLNSAAYSGRVTYIGLAITFATLLVLGMEFARHRRLRFPAYGWVGLGLLAAAEVLLFRRVWPVTVYFTPAAWTGYILLADAMVFAVRGRSRLHDSPRGLLLVAALSIPLWLVFEAYDVRLRNWTYVGVPHQWAAALLGYGWSFATITPGIFETGDLVESFGWFRAARPVRFSNAAEWGMVVFGAACLIVPLALPQPIAAYLFALVWIGFVFLLDPLNHRLGLPSLLGDLAEGRRGRLYSLFLAGWVCGWLWEFWNYWATAKWHYIFPMFQRWKIFEMPAPGFLGFLPFALECFVMYVTASWALRGFSAPVAEGRARPVE